MTSDNPFLKILRSSRQSRVVLALQQFGPLTTRDICEITGYSYRGLMRPLSELMHAQAVERIEIMPDETRRGRRERQYHLSAKMSVVDNRSRKDKAGLP